MASADQTIRCRECRQPFNWSAGERSFYAARGLCPPKQCRPCRQYWRAPKAERGPRPGGERPRRQELVDALEAAHAELVLTGHPLASAAATGLKSGRLAALRFAHAAVVAWREAEGGGPV